MLAEFRAAIGRIFSATDGRDILKNTPDGWEVDRPWLWWDGGSDGGQGDVWGNPPPGAWPHFKRLLPAMARCRALICDTLAGVPWDVYRGAERLTTPDWILDPQGLRPDSRTQAEIMDVRLSAVEFWSSFLVSALELGEGIIYAPNRDATDAPLPPLFQINPIDLDIRNGEYVVMGETLAPEELIIVRNRVWPGKQRGVGVWAEFAHTLNMGNRLGEYVDNMLGRGIPAGYLQVTAPDLTEDEAERLKQRWMRAHGGSRRKIAVLNATTQFHPLQIDAKALEISELMKLSAWDICLIYGIPPYKLGINMGASNTYANIESQGIEYVADALLAWSRRIESAFDARFPRGTSLKLNLDGLRRADTKTRYEAHKLGLDGGWLTIDEVREREDLEPMTDIQQRQAADYAINRRKLEAS